jgi:3-hydroxybutyryl-CoA dehydrogenase
MIYMCHFSNEKGDSWMKIQRIAVIGAGLMGSGIAQSLAMGGMDVRLYDVSEEALTRGLAGVEESLARLVRAERITERDAEAVRTRILSVAWLQEAVADAELVVEAIPEQLALKQDVFRQLDHAAPQEAILATNTSELSVTAIAAVTGRPEKVAGMHWFYPAPIMPLVEIVRGIATAEATVEAIRRVAVAAGKETVVVNDSPGFVTTRGLAAYLTESMRMLEEGVATAEEIDRAMRLGLNHPMGPFELADAIGLDTVYLSGKGLMAAYGDRFRPPQVLVKRVEAGHLGKKTGKGFYDYTKETIQR